MKRSLQQAILDQLSITRRPGSEQALPSFGKREWSHALGWLDLSGLAIYFHHRMACSNRLAAIPDGPRKTLERRTVNNQHRTEDIIQELGILSESLSKAGVKYAVLKGIA